MARETQTAWLAAASSPAASELDDVQRLPTASERSEAKPRKRATYRLPTSSAVRSRPPRLPTPLGRRAAALMIDLLLFFQKQNLASNVYLFGLGTRLSVNGKSTLGMLVVKLVEL